MNPNHDVYLHLGSNLGDRQANLQKARVWIDKLVGPVRKTSRLYQTAPWGNPDQPWFFNQAVLVQTGLEPTNLLENLQQIEQKGGRERVVKWSARTLDIDVIFYGNKIVKQPNLVIPHPQMHLRNFVLVPLMEIAADVIHPLLACSVEELYDHCEDPLEVVLIE